MALSKFEKDMAIISALDDEPNDVGGLSAEQLKAKFDEGGQAIKEFLNNKHFADLNATFATKEELNTAAVGSIYFIHEIKFSEQSWTEETDGSFQMSIPQSSHRLQGDKFLYNIFHLVSGKYIRNTWAAQETEAQFDETTSSVILSSGYKFPGKITLVG